MSIKGKIKIVTYDKTSPLASVKIAPFDIRKRFTKPHRHNKYLELVYFSKGEGFHHLDLKSYLIEPPIVFVVKKEEVHHWEITSIPKGYVIIIKESFLSQTLDKHINTKLSELDDVQKIKLPKNDPSLEHLFESLCWEMEQDVIQQDVIEGGLKAVLSKIVSYLTDDTMVSSSDKATQFKELLSTTLRNNVSFYAEALNTSPQNLNAICHKIFDKTVSEVIAEHLIKEVKRQLIYTDAPVSEIAYKLKFKDTSHFTKYFKRHTNLTPLQFKKNPTKDKYH